MFTLNDSFPMEVSNMDGEIGLLWFTMIIGILICGNLVVKMLASSLYLAHFRAIL